MDDTLQEYLSISVKAFAEIDKSGIYVLRKWEKYPFLLTVCLNLDWRIILNSWFCKGKRGKISLVCKLKGTSALALLICFRYIRVCFLRY